MSATTDHCGNSNMVTDEDASSCATGNVSQCGEHLSIAVSIPSLYMFLATEILLEWTVKSITTR